MASKSAAAVSGSSADGGKVAQGKSIAVIGGGSAGAMTAVELLRRKEVSKVTLFEQADRIGHVKSASGIIAALLITDPSAEYWNNLDSVDDFVDKASWLNVDSHATKARLIKFAARAAAEKVKKDPRHLKAYQNRFFQKGGRIVEELVEWRPELCEAIVGPFCCKEHTRAFKWMQDEGKKKGMSCDYRNGVAHIFYTHDDWFLAGNKDKAGKGNWTLWTPGTQRLRAMEDYLKINLTGAVFQSHNEGFVRVELLYPLLTQIFQEEGKVELQLNCLIKEMNIVEDGKVEVILDTSQHDCKFNGKAFDKVIVAAGAYSVPILSKVDYRLPWQMVPVKGFAIQSDHDYVMERERMIGLEFEESGQYIRAQENGGVRYGFGRVIGTFEDELLDPKFEHWRGKYAPALTGLGREMLDDNRTKRLCGMRPVSMLGNFPLLKSYTGDWSGVLLNSGFGFYGYGLTWNAARVIVDVALHDKVLDEKWKDAVEFTTGVCGWWEMTCWPDRMYMAVGGVIALLILVILCVLSCCCWKRPECCCGPYTKVPAGPPGNAA